MHIQPAEAVVPHRRSLYWLSLLHDSARMTPNQVAGRLPSECWQVHAASSRGSPVHSYISRSVHDHAAA